MRMKTGHPDKHSSSTKTTLSLKPVYSTSSRTERTRREILIEFLDNPFSQHDTLSSGR
jgi:hypothetical protein